MNRCLVLGTLLLGLPGVVQATEFKSRAEEITFTGRLQPQWRTSSVEGEASNDFLIRRARAALRVKVNKWWSGVVEADFAGGTLAVKDAHIAAQLHDNFMVRMGQTKRPFDIFELTSSTQILIIERDGRVGANTRVPSLSRFTEALQFADRDVGVFATTTTAAGKLIIDVGITNGTGADKAAKLGEKAYQARLAAKPVADLQINAGFSMLPFERAIATATTDNDVDYATAFEGSLELGNFDSGPHAQAGFVIGDNWNGVHTDFDPLDDPDEATPTFFAVQAIGTYKMPVENRWFESIEPVARVSFANPNLDTGNDSGVLLTPGVNFFAVSRNRFSMNVDVFLPEGDGSTESSFKAQSWLYW